MRRVISFLIPVILLAGDFAGALTCMPPPRTEEEARERIEPVETIFLGRVEEIVCRSWADGAEIRADTYVRLMVVEGFKGVTKGTEVELGIDRCAYASNYFEFRDTYLILAYSSTLDVRPHTNECNFFIYETAHELTPGQNARLREFSALFLKVLRESQ